MRLALEPTTTVVLYMTCHACVVGHGRGGRQCSYDTYQVFFDLQHCCSYCCAAAAVVALPVPHREIDTYGREHPVQQQITDYSYAICAPHAEYGTLIDASQQAMHTLLLDCYHMTVLYYYYCAINKYSNTANLFCDPLTLPSSGYNAFLLHYE